VPNNLEAGAMNTNSMESKSKGILENGEPEEIPERITPLKHFKDLDQFDDFRENEPITRVATSNKLKSQVTSKRLSPKMTLKYKIRDSERASQIKIESNLSKVMRENSSVRPRESNNFEYSLYSARAPCNPPANLHSVPPAQEQKLEHLRLKVKNHNQEFYGISKMELQELSAMPKMRSNKEERSRLLGNKQSTAAKEKEQKELAS
jgi:hypothetical protein